MWDGQWRGLWSGWEMVKGWEWSGMIVVNDGVVQI